MNTALFEPTPRGDHGTRGSVGLRTRAACFLAFWPWLTLKQILAAQSPRPCAWEQAGEMKIQFEVQSLKQLCQKSSFLLK